MHSFFIQGILTFLITVHAIMSYLEQFDSLPTSVYPIYLKKLIRKVNEEG